MTVTPIPYIYRRHKKTGAKITRFSVLPYGSYEDWETVTDGWTWEVVSNRGTVSQGLGRMPVKTRNEAAAIAEKVMSF